eukprot:s931_g9.t1
MCAEKCAPTNWKAEPPGQDRLLFHPSANLGLPAEPPVPMRLSAPLAVLALGGALLGRATSCQGDAGDACLVDLVERDENLLLQHQRSAGAKREQKNATKPVALALSGGGFLAHSSLSGIFAALLSFTNIQIIRKLAPSNQPWMMGLIQPSHAEVICSRWEFSHDSVASDIITSDFAAMADVYAKAVSDLREQAERATDSLIQNGLRLLIMGGSGVGKSAVVNACFGRHLADVSHSIPCQQSISHFPPTERCPLHLYDTKGFETQSSNEDILKDLTQLLQERRAASASKSTLEEQIPERLHAVWWVVDFRLEVELFNTVAKLFEDDEVPIFIILNKCDRGMAEVDECLEAAKTQCPRAAAVIPFVAEAKNGPMRKACEVCNTEEIMVKCNPRTSIYRCENPGCREYDKKQEVKPAYGMEELFRKTAKRLPEVVAKSFREAEIECLNLLQHQSLKIIAACIALAGAAGAVPVPFSDCILLAPIQMTMFASLAKLYEVQVSTETAGCVMSSFSGGGAIGISGRGLGSLMKLIPGIGSLIGGVCSATIASCLTGAMGFLFQEMFKRIRSKALFGEMTFDDFCQVMNVQEQKEFLREKFQELQREPLQEVPLPRSLVEEVVEGVKADLFKHVEAISCASAGGWFMGQLAFSPQFLNLIQTMGNESHKAGERYQKEWVWKFLTSLAVGQRPTKRTDDEIERAQAQVEALRADKSLWGLDEDFLELLVEFYWITSDGENRTWVELIGDLMGATAGGDITGATTLGSPVNAWAEGKNLVIGTSITTPGDTGPGSCNDRDASGWFCVGPRVPQALIYRNYSAFVGYSSRAEGVDALPIAVWSPARFSVKMGRGPNQPPPMSFCPSCNGLEVTYKSTVDPRGASKMADSFNYNSNAPLVGSVAAGSAFLGELVVLPFFDAQYLKLAAEKIANLVEKIPFVGGRFRNWLENKLYDALMTQFPVWGLTASTASTSFQEGASLVRHLAETGGKLSEQAFESLAQRQLLAFADGGLSDNSAIGNAVATGLNDILHMTYSGLDNLERLLAGVRTDNQILNLVHLNFCPFCYANFQVFAEDVPTVRAMYPTQLKSLQVQHSSQLKSVQIGTLQLTTVDCPYFGIEAGRSINLHIISVSSRSGIGGIGYQTYNTLIQEIVDAFRDPMNSQLSSEVLGWLM